MKRVFYEPRDRRRHPGRTPLLLLRLMTERGGVVAINFAAEVLGGQRQTIIQAIHRLRSDGFQINPPLSPL